MGYFGKLSGAANYLSAWLDLRHEQGQDVAPFVEEAVRILDTSGLTDVKYVATVGSPIVARLEKAGTLTPFMFAVQLLAVMLIDASELPTDD